MMKKEEITVTVVRWKDASYDDEIRYKDDIDDDPYLVISTGVLVKETEEILILAIEKLLKEKDLFRHILSIPKEFIISRNDRKIRI